MDFDVIMSCPTYHLSQAILLYGMHQRDVGLATIHEIEETKTGPVLKEGRRITEEAVRDVIKKLAGNVKNRLSVLDPSVIAASDDVLAWYVPAAARRVCFKTKEIGNRAAVTPHPALLFAVSPKGWHIFALASDDRPTAKTKLYVAPYFNVWEGGKICTGSTELPKAKDRMNPHAWTKAFFASAFTHPNIREDNQLVRHKFGPYAFWRDMLDGKYERFPDVLVPTELTVEKLLEQL